MESLREKTKELIQLNDNYATLKGATAVNQKLEGEKKDLALQAGEVKKALEVEKQKAIALQNEMKELASKMQITESNLAKLGAPAEDGVLRHKLTETEAERMRLNNLVLALTSIAKAIPDPKDKGSTRRTVPMEEFARVQRQVVEQQSKLDVLAECTGPSYRFRQERGGDGREAQCSSGGGGGFKDTGTPTGA